MLIQITVVQKDANLKVACILPAIPNDPEGEVSLEGEYSEELENMADISKRGYKFKITDWASRTVNVHDALFEMTGAAGAPLQFEHVEVGESSTPNGESVIGKINKIVETMEKKFKLMKDRVCFLEEENRELKERVSELEGKQNLGTDFSTDMRQQEPLTGLPASPLSQINETQDFSPNLTRHKESFSNETPTGQTPNVTQQQEETQPSSDETPSNPNQAEQNLGDEIEKEILSNETPTPRTQIEKKPISNDTPAAQTQVLTPNVTQQKEIEQTFDETPSNPNGADENLDDEHTTDPLTEVISSIAAQYKNSDDETQTGTQVLTPNMTQTDAYSTLATPNASLIFDENQNVAVAETQTETQFFSLDSKQQTPSKPNPEEGNPEDEDTTEPMTEIISTNILETTPLSQQTEALSKTSPIDFSETEKAEESSLPALFEIGADVEIASNDDTTCRIWYQGKVVDQNLCDGVEKLTVEYSTLFADQKRVQDTVTTDRIRPPPPTTEQKAYQLYEKVEGLYNNGWCSGQVSMTFRDNTYSIYLNNSMETINFEPFHLRIHREWTDGVWKTPDEMGPDYFKRLSETQSQKLSQQDHVMEEKPDKKRKANSTYLRRSERVPKRSRDTKTPFKSERNPALTVTREMIPEVDPFSTLAVHKVKRFQDWLMSKGGIHGVTLSINDTKTGKSFFRSIENEKIDLKKSHIEGAFAMLNCRIVDNPAWFHNYKIPKACFLPMTFLSTLGYYVDLIEKRKAEGKKIFADGQRELVRGEIYPHTKWGEDVEVLYGAITGRYGNHWIVLLPALMMEAFGKEVDKVVPYKIEKAEGIPKTHSSYNCGLFVLKMLECHSLKIENMSKINDANALELRRSLSFKNVNLLMSM
ncbi:hypothetical protein Bca4012_036569 [Brassica carinata]